jgi:adhesin transport system membrane fusion protein
VAALRTAIARLNAEVLGSDPVFPSEINGYPEFRSNQEALFRRRKQALTAELESLRQSLNLAKQELDLNKPLLETGDVSRSEIIRLQRQVNDIDAQIINRNNKFLQDAQAELAKTQEDLSGAMQTLAQRREQVGYTVIRAPMDGIVRNVRLTTRGGVAKPGEEIMQIVPADDELIIEAKVRPADIGFIKPGLKASIKLDAYDYTIYGTLNGEVRYISADAMNEDVKSGEQPYFRVQIKTSISGLASKKQEKIDIQPGMTAVVEIKTGAQTVWRYLTKPITKTMSESLSER